MSEENEDDKQHEASQKKLDDARKRGELPRSADLLTAAGYAGLLLAALGLGAKAMTEAGAAGMIFLGQADRLSAINMKGGALSGSAVLVMIGPLLPFLLLPGAAVLLVVVSMRGLVFAPEKIAAKSSRISPIAIAGQKFGRDGLFEFAKSFVKLLLVGTILAMFLLGRGSEILGTVTMAPAIGVATLLRILIEFMAIVLCAALVIGGVDYLWQLAQHQRRNRMSRKEMMDEMKDSEGDPHLKAHRRQRAQEVAMNRMLSDVATADVVVVNPTHYAVALKWQRGSRTAPICVAKGVDEIAARIRERAALAGVPIHSDPPTARAVHATVRIGQEIRPEHYRAVAAAIRFAEAMRKKARRFPQ